MSFYDLMCLGIAAICTIRGFTTGMNGLQFRTVLALFAALVTVELHAPLAQVLGPWVNPHPWDWLFTISLFLAIAFILTWASHLVDRGARWFSLDIIGHAAGALSGALLALLVCVALSAYLPEHWVSNSWTARELGLGAQNFKTVVHQIWEGS